MTNCQGTGLERNGFPFCSSLLGVHVVPKYDAKISETDPLARFPK